MSGGREAFNCSRKKHSEKKIPAALCAPCLRAFLAVTLLCIGNNLYLEVMWHFCTIRGSTWDWTVPVSPAQIFALAFSLWSSGVSELQMAAYHTEKTLEESTENVWVLCLPAEGIYSTEMEKQLEWNRVGYISLAGPIPCSYYSDSTNKLLLYLNPIYCFILLQQLWYADLQSYPGIWTPPFPCAWSHLFHI